MPCVICSERDLKSDPLIAFAKIQRFDLLYALFGEILIPEAVHDEFSRMH
ncbi:MAG: hypothetical protein GY862_15655 [Gammaproteobacteria bacterium]|nr:hypothetical protein [Gammaproteobacteria bacterium]